MQIEELEFQNLAGNLLKPYQKRAATEPAQFHRWFLEIFFASKRRALMMRV